MTAINSQRKRAHRWMVTHSGQDVLARCVRCGDEQRWRFSDKRSARRQRIDQARGEPA